MQTTKSFLGLLIFLACLLISCSNQKADYEEAQKLQDASEQVFQRSTDYDTRIKSCDDVINALQGFLNKHKDGEWSNVAKNALSSWQERKTYLQQEISSLTEQLSSKLANRAAEEAQKVHPASNIENLNLDNSTKTKEGNNIIFNDIYSVRMRGAILGTHIFKLIVRISGGVAMDSKKVFVNDDAKVEE